MIALKRHFLALVALCLFQLPLSASACDAAEAVCVWADRIVGIKTPNMIASGTMIADGFIVQQACRRGSRACNDAGQRRTDTDSDTTGA